MISGETVIELRMPHFTYREARSATTPATNWSKFVAHPLADLLLWFLANVTPWIHPNAVTLAAAALGGGAALCFVQGTRAGLIAGALLFHASFCLDAIDGALARLLGKRSVVGAWLDTMLDFVRSMLLAPALAIGAYRQTGDVDALYAGFAVQAVGLWYYYLAEATQKILGKRPAEVAKASSSAVARVVRRVGLVPSPFGLADCEGLYLVVFPLLGRPVVGMVAAAALGGASRLATSAVVLRHLVRRPVA